MNISRRQFLRGTAAGAAGLMLPAWLVAEPKRTIFLPPKGGWVTGEAQLVKPYVRTYVSKFGVHRVGITPSGCRDEATLLRAIQALYYADEAPSDVVVTPECWAEIERVRGTFR